MLKRFGVRSLFWRVFLHGLTVLLVAAMTFAALAAVLIEPAMERRMWEVGRWLAPLICRDLRSLKTRPQLAGNIVATAYSASGQLIGSAVSPPVPPLPQADVARLRAEKAISLRSSHALHAFWCANEPGGAYLELAPPAPPPLRELATPFALVIVVVGFASIPFARSIARPMDELVNVTHAIGRGDLSARTEISRGDEVGQLARAFNTMADRLQRLILAEQELLANVSHELRTPISRMRVVLEMARENPKRAQSLLEEIGSDLADLERLVETVMEAMRLDMGTSTLSGGLLPVHMQRIDVREVLHDATALFELLYPERALEVKMDSAAAPVRGDRRMLRRLLENLLDNARKYSDPSTPIRVSLHVDPGDAGRVHFAVVDRGVGIDASELVSVFEPFFRGTRGRAQAATGAGLGLALAKKIVAAHGGEIAVASEVNTGTSVGVSLPWAGLATPGNDSETSRDCDKMCESSRAREKSSNVPSV